MERRYNRAPNGKFLPGSTHMEGAELSQEHRDKIRRLAQQRANLSHRHISVCGVVYPNLTQAAAAVGVSTRTLQRYADSECVLFAHVFFVDTKQPPATVSDEGLTNTPLFKRLVEKLVTDGNDPAAARQWAIETLTRLRNEHT